MGVTFNHLTTGSDTSNTLSYTAASIAPAANRIVYLAVLATVSSGTAPAPTISGGPSGLTWELVRQAPNPSAIRTLYWYRAATGASAPTPGAVKFTFGAALTGCMWAVYEAAGADMSGANGSAATVQSIESRLSAQTGLNAAFTNPVDPANGTLCVMGLVATATITPGSGWSSPGGTTQYATPSQSLAGMHANTAQQNAVATWGTSANTFVIAIEVKAAAPTGPTTYYVSAAGSDSNDGKSPSTPWATISKVNAASLNPGDSVLFRGGDTFSGSIYVDTTKGGTPTSPVTFGSYGAGLATITSSAGHAFNVYQVGGLIIRDLVLTGTGTAFSSYSGVSLYKDTAGRADYVQLLNLDISGFQFGIAVGGAAGGGGYSNVTVSGCALHGNRDNGFIAYGPTFTPSTPNYAHANITVTKTVAYSNLGNTANTTSHTGSGVIIGSAQGGSIDQCTAYNNGASNGCTTMGPVGLWAYDSDSVVISRSVAYSNHSGTVADGGGFDLDMNVSNSRIEYCLAYSNDGAGILLFGNTGNTAHTGNTARYNLCWGNGRNAGGYGDITVYGTVLNSSVFNNTVVSVTNGTVQPSPVSVTGGTPSGLTIRNNVFQVRSTGPVVKAASALASTAALFQGNNYYSTGTLSISWGGTSYPSLAAWRAAVANQEVVAGANTGFVGDPLLVNPGIAPTVTDPTVLTGAAGLALLAASPVARAGLDLAASFGTSAGDRDYFGSALTPPYSVGGAEQDTAAAAPVSVSFSGAGTLSVPTSGFTGAATADLAGTGSLTATPAASAARPAVLIGAGTLSAALTASSTVSISLSSVGSLATSAQPLALRTSALAGLGTATATVTPSGPRSAGLVGTGALTVAVTATAQLPCALNGAGTLSASTSAPIEISAVALGGSGALSVTVAGSATSVAAQLSGLGTLATGTGSQVPPIAINVSGGGTLTAQLGRMATLAVGLTGNGSLTTAVTAVTTSSAALFGAGTLGAALASTRALSVALAGSGSLATATGSQAPPVTADLLGSGILSVSVAPTATRSAPLTGSSSLVAAVASASSRSVSLAGAGSLTGFAGVTAPPLTAPLAGSGQLTTAVVPRATGAASVTGSGVLSVSLEAPTISIAAALAGAGLLAAQGTVAPYAISSDLSADGRLSVEIGPAVAVSASLAREGWLSAGLRVVGEAKDLTFIIRPVAQPVVRVTSRHSTGLITRLPGFVASVTPRRRP